MRENHWWEETILIGVASAILCLGLLAVELATTHKIEPKPLLWGVMVPLAGLASHIFLCWGKKNTEPYIFPLILFLIAIGLTMLFRLKAAFFTAQVLWVLVGLGIFSAVASLLPSAAVLEKYKYTYGIIGIFLIAVTTIFGVDIGGHRDWLILGPIHIETYEFAKIFVILFLAGYLSENREILMLPTRKIGILSLPPLRFIAPLLAMWGLAMLMLMFQRDLGAAILFFGTFIIMVYMTSGRISYTIMGLCLFALGAVPSYFLYAHVHGRVAVWLNPWQDPNGSAYQVVQSLFALGSGGMLGSGLTYGHPLFIPEVHTDFIFAAIAEEMGFAGSAALMLAFILLSYRLFRGALRAQRAFAALTIGGLASLFTLQVFIIIAGVTKFLPLTGVTLPFVSYGGSSMVSNFILMGIIYRMIQEGGGYA